MELVSEYCYTHKSFMLHGLRMIVGDYIGFTYDAPTMSERLKGEVHGFDLSAGLVFVILYKKRAVYGYPVNQIRDVFFPDDED